MHLFELSSQYQPTGDQPEAIEQLTQGLRNGETFQTLLGVTGSGKTFTMANVIARAGKPTLVISHNKTLAAQLYNEFKQFFPKNQVEYFVSYYDYYQPEAYIPSTDTYIEKDLAINEEIDKLRLSAIAALLSGRKDVIVVSSVSCIYGLGSPVNFTENCIHLERGKDYSRKRLLSQLVNAQYVRNEMDLVRGNFRVQGDTIDIAIPYADYILRIVFWDNEIDEIVTLGLTDFHIIDHYDSYELFPATIFTTTPESIGRAVDQISVDLGIESKEMFDMGKEFEGRRLIERVNYDLEMMKEVGYCSGIENYSRYFDGRPPGSHPYCLLDYFPKDFLMIVDESHVTIPQFNGMYSGDRSRKENLVNYGFRLKAALDNRPLKFQEFEEKMHQVIFVSATPADYELEKSGGVFVEQIIRPTGLLDPEIEVRSSRNQIDDLMEEIELRCESGERTLVTTLTKRMAEELDEYLCKNGVRCRYIHSGVDTIERIEILDDLRAGSFDVLIGVNLLREGLDLPQVSLVAILDADKEGFLRNHKSLTQTVGRAARNVHGKAIMYADKITKSMQLTIDETTRRRNIQLKYNEKNHITPHNAVSSNTSALNRGYAEGKESLHIASEPKAKAYIEKEWEQISIAADPVIGNMNKEQLCKAYEVAKRNMNEAARKLDFVDAAHYRDEMLALEKMINSTYA